MLTSTLPMLSLLSEHQPCYHRHRPTQRPWNNNVILRNLCRVHNLQNHLFLVSTRHTYSAYFYVCYSVTISIIQFCGNFLFFFVCTRNILKRFFAFISTLSVCGDKCLCRVSKNFNLKAMQQRSTPSSIEIYNILTRHGGIVPLAHIAHAKNSSSNFKAHVIVLHVVYNRHFVMNVDGFRHFFVCECKCNSPSFCVACLLVCCLDLTTSS